DCDERGGDRAHQEKWKEAVDMAQREQRACIGANAVEGSVTKRREARIAEKKIERHRKDGEDQSLRRDVDPETRRPQRNGRESQSQDHHEARSPGSPQTLRNHTRRPRRPDGRTTSTTAISAKIRPIANCGNRLLPIT